MDTYVQIHFCSHGVFQLRRLWSDYNERRVGTTDLSRPPEHRIWYRTHGQHRNVSCLNGIIAELIAACTLELPFNSIPALKVS
jgi:hypothetical protein